MSTNPISEELLADLLAEPRSARVTSYDLAAILTELRDRRAADSRANQASEARKRVYAKLAEEGGGTWATYMYAEIEEAFAALGSANQAVVTEALKEILEAPEDQENAHDNFQYIKDIASTALEALSRAEGQEPAAWEGYWPGAGSVDSATTITRHRSIMEQWAEDGAEVTPLYRSVLVKAPAPAVLQPVATHRHKKRDENVVLIGIGKMQAKGWWKREVDHHGTARAAEVDMRPVAIYQSVDDGSLWARPIEEWEDGRFEVLAAPSQPLVRGEGE